MISPLPVATQSATHITCVHITAMATVYTAVVAWTVEQLMPKLLILLEPAVDSKSSELEWKQQ